MPLTTLDIFKEMCDLIFVIAEEEDDVEGNRSRYLNRHIAEWSKPKPKQALSDNSKQNRTVSKEVSKEDSNSRRLSAKKENSIPKKEVSNCLHPHNQDSSLPSSRVVTTVCCCSAQSTTQCVRQPQWPTDTVGGRVISKRHAREEDSSQVHPCLTLTLPTGPCWRGKG